ncbi:MAG: thiamine phosphate synthase [Chlorobi bacterium]|nr:thiamine phosphate synthase [Chlorobiota bacterium]MCI0717206.1 thiamine phosphate synthase [Chlorobiota bacterium]
MKKIGRLCVITDTSVQKKYSHYEITKMAIKGGADVIQLRDKSLPTGELIETAIKIKKLCSKHKVLFIINDRVDIALISKADGVHLGKQDISIKDTRKLLGKNKIIGGTAHSLKEAIKREKEGADYIGFGHIYPTESKLKKAKPKGINYLKRVVKKVKIPVLAIGGINQVNIKDVICTGVHGAAVIGAVVKSTSPVKAVKKLRNAIYE